MSTEPARTFSPAMPLPRTFDRTRRIKILKDHLNPQSPLYYKHEGQHINIRAAIDAYEKNLITEEVPMIFQRGKVVSAEEAWNAKDFFWTETSKNQHQYITNKAIYRPLGTQPRHQLLMELRLFQDFGGDGTIHGIAALNDTGSTLLTLLDIDFAYLGDIGAYRAWGPFIDVENASGDIDLLLSLFIEVRLVDPTTLLPWSAWIQEVAIVRDVRPGMIRLSGSGIRDFLNFGTGPGNQFVSVSRSRNGMTTQL